jgi:hypothetical protein
MAAVNPVAVAVAVAFLRKGHKCNGCNSRGPLQVQRGCNGDCNGHKCMKLNSVAGATGESCNGDCNAG